MVRAVIFDWDLTLWNSWGIHLMLMERTALDLGITPPTAGQVAAEFHRPFRQHLLRFFGSAPDNASRLEAEGELDAILESYLGHYHGNVGRRNYLFPGAASLLRGLHRRGIRIGVLSDKISCFGDGELAQSGLAPLVEYADFKTDDRPYKPAPDGLRRVLNAMNLAPEDAMYVGDGPQDIICAHRVGVVSVAALWATIDRDAVLAQGPDYRLHRPHQVMAVVAEANGYADTDPWRRHLPWPWRPDADNPADDQDAPASAGSPADYTEPPPANWQFWPHLDGWQGRSRELALPPEAANPIAPLNRRGSTGAN